MKKVLAISGSASATGANVNLLETIADAFTAHYRIGTVRDLGSLPLFTPEKLKDGTPEYVQDLKQKVTEAEAVIISTPEYLHNIPAVLKNALEWMTESGELSEKRVLAITFTPHEPRGEHAMRSLVRSLKASKANVVAELPLYQNQLRNDAGQIVLDEEHYFLLREALNLL